MQSSNLFSTEVQNLTTTPILLIDCSGSVRTPFTKPTFYGTIDASQPSIFQTMRTIIEKLPEDQFRIIFWCSDQQSLTSTFFKKGCYTLPFVVKKATLKQTFLHVEKQISNGCLTFPHLAFEEILSASFSNFFSPLEPTKIYLLTDGEMGYSNIPSYELSTLKRKLSENIKTLFNKFNVQLNIITVEAKDVDYSNSETIKTVAGNDVYNVIQENKLTNYVSSFTSYSLNNLNGFVHMSKIIVPKGFIGFGTQYFSQTKTREFINYLNTLVSSERSEDKLLEIVQKLATTVSQLSKDKPVSIRDGILNTFCNIFNNTCLDPMFVKFILTEAVKNENQGTANVFAMYRAQLKDLYKQATELIFKGVGDAIGVGQNFVTFPINNIIVCGSGKLVKENCGGMGKKLFPQGGVLYDNIILPVFPQGLPPSAMNRQCLRQWTRSVISKLYNVDQMGDIVIFTVLALNVLISCGDAPETTKSAFRNLSTVMLGKKRLNSDITELENLEAGNPPVPNSGKVEEFYKIMNTIQRIFSQFNNLNPFSIWYAMCVAYGNEKIIDTQYAHCVEDLAKDGIDISQRGKNILEKINKIPFLVIEQNDLASLDYSCLITLEDTSRTGGYRFKPHSSNNSLTSVQNGSFTSVQNGSFTSVQECSPIYVLSETGYEQMISSPERSVCPICYTSLGRDNFEKVGAKPTSSNEVEGVFKDVSNIFSPNAQSAITNNLSVSQNIPARSSNTQSAFASANKTVVIMKGVVGGGKTTFCEKLALFLKEKGGEDTFVLSTGTDKFCKDGISTQQAIHLVSEELQTAFTTDKKNVFVIIDTCGEKENVKNIFGCDFSSFKKVVVFPNLVDRKPETIELYLAWTLRNVLKRGSCNSSSNFYLNPYGATLRVCIDVHSKKAKNLLGKNVKLPQIPSGNLDEIISSLDEKANKYENMLSEKLTLQDQIQKSFNFV